MASLRSYACVLVPVAFHLLLAPIPSSAGVTRRCGSIYKGFASCLLALGDSLSQSAQKDEDMQEIDSICRSWDDFHACANMAMAGCPDEAAAVWESLRQESKKMQFSGNLYDMCSNRAQPASPTDAKGLDGTNQESLRSLAAHSHAGHHALFLSCLSLLWLLHRK
ncbi:neuritin 1-like a [Denticeps clupeoides]|uniref:Uncharacterized protein n=1 Tax=Denticeps clupeoides TaxID=299321 RepID=A0AAY4EVU3_9TELE|nr:neuritin-like protein [Denticeps clupeoides]